MSVLGEDGTLDPEHDPHLSNDEVVALYRHLVETRLLDERFVALQRQGRIGFHVGSLGEEAAILGSAFAMREQDWLFPCYREFGAALMRGMPLQTLRRQHVRQRQRHREGPADARPLHVSESRLGVDQLAGRHADHPGGRLRLGRQDPEGGHRRARVLRRRRDELVRLPQRA